MEKTYCKIVLVARMGAGVATPAFCAKRAFEKQGHTVFLFTPKMWPERFASDPTFTHIAYSARSSAACVVFGDLGAGSQNANAPADAREVKSPADALLTDETLVLVHTDGAKLACVGEGLSPWRAERMDICEKDVTAAREALIAAVAEQHSGDAAFESRRLPIDSQGPFLDGSLLAALESVREQLSERGLMAGLPAPRTIVSVLGYVGMGNFGDEYILATVDRRLRELIRGCSIVAVGENPLHTLRERGIYSITLQDKRVLDRVLAASSAALVIAGLLFDQGIRWSIGKAELASSMPHTDIAGIAAYVELAYMNDARPVLYGIGAGPLDVADGRSLVRLMGRLGALFLTRDEATAELVRSCRVRNEQVISLADCAFLGSASDTSFVDEWLASEGIDPASRRVVAVSLREYENAPRISPSGLPPRFRGYRRLIATWSSQRASSTRATVRLPSASGRFFPLRRCSASSTRGSA